MKTSGSLRGLPGTGTGDSLKLREPEPAILKIQGTARRWGCHGVIPAGGSVRLFVSSPALHCFSSRAIDVLLKTNSFLSLARLFSIFPLLFPFFLRRPAVSLPRRSDGTLVSLSLARSLARSPTRRFCKFPESTPRLIAIVEWANSRESANFSATFFLSHIRPRFFSSFLFLNCNVLRTPFLESLRVL